MSKSPSRPASASHDDIAGLFTRLGGGDSGYRDFSDSHLIPSPAPAVPPPLPAVATPAATAAAPAEAVAVIETASVVAPAAAVAAAPAVAAPAAKASVVRIEPPKDVQGKPVAKTSLERLFQRLAEAAPPAAPGEDSPLKRFRAS